MEKALVFSDLHVHNYKNFNEDGRRLKNGVAFIDYIFKLANANGIKLILMPGDLMNNMQIINTKVVNAVAACLQMNFTTYPGISLIAISGNHDDAEKNLLDNPSESALDYLDYVFPNFILLDHYPHTFHVNKDTVIRGIRYFEHPEHFRTALEEASKERLGRTILLTHQTIGSGLPIEDTIEPDDELFHNFDFIFNGHIHTGEQLTDKFVNVGSPMARDAGDIGKAKGFWIVDLDNPVETIAFKDITDRYPVFIHKTQGEALTEWEKQQYVIWQPAPIADKVKDQQLAEKFSTNLSPSVIITNYCSEVLSKEKEEYLKYGLTLIK